MIGNQFLVRGYENGKQVMFKEEYSPTLFIKSNKKTKYKTLEGEYVQEIKPGSVKDCREFYKKYDDVDNFKIYGNDRYIYQYISDKYPEDEIKFDINKIKLYTIDIEVASENGFPDPKDCAEEILLITIQDYSTKQIITWGNGPFRNNQENVKYIQCDSEYDLLVKFLY
ncbi:MAG: DNA polymerase, partial [Candidatus Fonsibacter ubiquis]